MNTVTIEVADRHTADARFLKAMKTGKPAGAFITFPTVEALWSALTVKRRAIVHALCGAGPVTLREAARRVGRIVFPYDAVHVDFVMQAAA